MIKKKLAVLGSALDGKEDEMKFETIQSESGTMHKVKDVIATNANYNSIYRKNNEKKNSEAKSTTQSKLALKPIETPPKKKPFEFKWNENESNGSKTKSNGSKQRKLGEWIKPRKLGFENSNNNSNSSNNNFNSKKKRSYGDAFEYDSEFDSANRRNGMNEKYSNDDNNNNGNNNNNNNSNNRIIIDNKNETLNPRLTTFRNMGYKVKDIKTAYSILELNEIYFESGNFIHAMIDKLTELNAMDSSNSSVEEPAKKRMRFSNNSNDTCNNNNNNSNANGGARALKKCYLCNEMIAADDFDAHQRDCIDPDWFDVDDRFY